MRRIRLWRTLIRLYATHLFHPPTWTEERRAQVCRDIEDTHAALGHQFYDWRTHGGTLWHFIREEDRPMLQAHADKNWRTRWPM